MEEIWRDIVGYEGLYQVSNLLNVRSLDRYDSRGCFRKGIILKRKTTTQNSIWFYMEIQKGGLKSSFFNSVLFNILF